jgi:hypothetical protein
MNRFVKLVSIIFLVFFVVTPIAANAAKHMVVNDALVQGADRLIGLQGTYFSPDTGKNIDNTWEWLVGDGNTYLNIHGVTATGLLAAYEKTKHRKYLNAAIAAGNVLVQRYHELGLNGYTWDDRPYSGDIEFLAWLSRASHNPLYGNVAVSWYGIVPANKTAAQQVDRFITTRLSLSGWDLASQIRAAMAVGQGAYAKAMAEELIRRSGEWVGIPYGGWDYTTLSYASLLWALDQVGGFHEEIAAYRTALINAQQSDGSWDEDYQETAYAIIGLVAVRGKGSMDALYKAATFLVNSQADLGGWVLEGYGELSEVDSEAVISLAALLKGDEITEVQKVKVFKAGKGKHKGHPFK